MQRTNSLLLTSLSLALVGACGGGNDEPPAPAQLRERIASDLGHVLGETTAAVEAGTAAVPSTAALTMLEQVLPEDGPISARTVKDALDEEGSGDDPLNADAAVAWLNEHIFTDANHVGGGIYEVPADVFCTETTFDDLGNESTELNQECAADFAQAELRVRVAADDDELSFAVQLGANHDEPLVVGLAHTRVSLTVDLDEALAAAEALAPIVGEELPNLDLSGALTGAIEVLGEDHAKISLSIDRAISVRFAEDGVALDGPDAFRFATAASNLAALEYDAVAEQGSIAFDLGATSLYEPDEQMALDLPGTSGTLSLAAGEPVQLTGLSLGDRTTTLKKAGATGLAIDLNPDDGRALDATLTGDDTSATLAVSPKLDLRVALDHAVLGDEAPVYDVTRVLLEGSLRGTEGSDSMEVASGTFSITTNPAQYGITATAGQCVSSEEVYDDTSGQYFTAFSSGVCQ